MRGGSQSDLPLLVALGLLLMLFLPPMAVRELWSTDELRYTEVAREMSASDSFVVPTLNGQLYREKPPLFFLLVDALEPLTGSHDLAGRLLSLLCVAGSAAWIVLLGQVLFGSRRTGLLAACIFLTTAIVMDHGQKVLLDNAVMFFAGLGSAALLAAARPRAYCEAWTALAALAMAAGCLIKGPVVVAIAVLGAAVAGGCWRGRRGVSFAAMAVAAVAALGVALLWLQLAALQGGGDYAHDLVFGQIERRLAGNAPHSEPIYYYLIRYPLKALPWFALLPGALALWRQERRKRLVRAVGALLAWIGVGIFLLSLVSGKRSGYVQPFFAPLALVIAWGLSRAAHTRDLPRLMRWPLALLPRLLLVAAGLLLTCSVALLLGLPDRISNLASEHLASLPPYTSGLLAVTGALVVLLGLHALRALADRRIQRLGLCFALGTALAVTAVRTPISHALNPTVAVKYFAEEAARISGPDAHVSLLRSDMDGRINLYTGVLHYRILPETDLERELNKQGRLWLIGRHQDWQRAAPSLRARLEIAYERKVGRRRLLLLKEITR